MDQYSKKILLVEDEIIIALNEQQTLRKYDYEVIIKTSGEKALTYLEENPVPDLILMDINLGSGIKGTEAAVRILEKWDIPLIFLSSHTEKEVVEMTEGITSYGYIVKNSGETVLLAAIKMAFKLFESNQKIAAEKNRYQSYLNSSLEGCQIIGFDWSYIFLNREAEIHNRRPNSELLGHTYMDMWPGIEKTEVFQLIKNTLEKRESHQMENFFTYPDGQTGWFKLNIRPCQEGVFISSLDITQIKAAQDERQMVMDFLVLVNECRNLQDLIHRSLLFFKQKSGMEAVGIRLKDGDNYPYIEALGFPAQFVEHENYLCNYDQNGIPILDDDGKVILECMCGNVIEGRYDSKQSFFTEKGSFWANNTTRLLATTSNAQRQAKTRNYCNGSGYESVGLFALKDGENTLGLLQLNDTRKNRFTKESVALWERLSGYLAVAFSKFKIKENLNITEKRYQTSLTEYKNFFNFVPALLCIASTKENRFTKINHLWTQTLGYTEPELLNQNFLNFVHPDDIKKTLRVIKKIKQGKTITNFVNRYRTAKGDYRYLEWLASPAKSDTLFASAKDITSLVNLQTQQDESIEEKQSLLSEIQHRIKNSFSMIADLISLSSSKINDSYHMRIFKELQVKILSISELYDLLFKNSVDTNNTIKLSDYLKKISEIITGAYEGTEINIDSDEIICNNQTAVPVGIITSELLTNVMKYAYPDSDYKPVFLSMKNRNGRGFLKIADKGVGIAAELDLENINTLGYKLVLNLTEQIHGVFNIIQDDGVTCTLDFKINA